MSYTLRSSDELPNPRTNINRYKKLFNYVVFGTLPEQLMIFAYFNLQLNLTILLNIFLCTCFNFITYKLFNDYVKDVLHLDSMILCGIVDFIVNIHVQSNCKVAII